MAKSKKPASPSKAPSPKQPAAPAGPVIDTSLAAGAAARLIGHRARPTSAQPAAAQESASFKQLKESLSKPHGDLIGDALHKIAPPSQQKNTMPHLADKQVGHNQTFSNITRTGVPRRTQSGS